MKGDSIYSTESLLFHLKSVLIAIMSKAEGLSPPVPVSQSYSPVFILAWRQEGQKQRIKDN